RSDSRWDTEACGLAVSPSKRLVQQVSRLGCKILPWRSSWRRGASPTPCRQSRERSRRRATPS
ncbi:unnamed protein product, partial [Ectocarpus fasciculatus]